MRPTKILLVEENSRRRQSLSAFLSRFDMAVETAPNLPAALADPQVLDRAAAAAVGLRSWQNGVDRELARLKVQNPRLAVVLIAAPRNPRPVLSLLERGIVDQVVSPGNPVGLYAALRRETGIGRFIRANAEYLDSMTRIKVERSRNLRRALELEEVYDTTLENLMSALDLRDVETFGHSQIVAKYSHVLAGLLGIQDRRVLDNIRKGALLHDVGKIAIPDAILKKPGPLIAEEWTKIKLHPALGYGLIKEIKFVREAGNIILCHHERYDGGGYPQGLGGSEIPLEARIFAVADALDAITSHRPYRRERGFLVAREEIRTGAGTQFDPEIVDAFSSFDSGRWEKVRFETTRLLLGMEDFLKLAG
ncbi:MAG: HD domain-containing protein [Candidatus Aminicenantes bacterium]|nr:HD domain-containing protein [Candidatus Aminicenantes bacterium]